jgi:hypothetical protein
MNMSFVLRLPREMHLCRYSSNVPRLPSFLEMPQNLHVLLTFDTVHNPLRLPREATSERPKVLRSPSVFCTFEFDMCFAPQRRTLFRHLNFQKWTDTKKICILTSKCASRHNVFHFINISSAKIGPNVECFEHSDVLSRGRHKGLCTLSKMCKT